MASTPTPGVDQLLGQASALTGSAEPPSAAKVKALAAQFESLFLSQMLNEMRGSMFADDDEEKESGFGGNGLTDTMYSQLSTALGQAGGIGLAQSMMGTLMKQAGVGDDSSSLDGTAPGGFDVTTALLNSGMAAPTAASALTPTAAVASMPGQLTSNYGWRRDPMDGSEEFHKGVDLAVPTGTDIPAARAGQVSFAGEMPGYGLTVEINHGGGVSTRYAHLSTLDVAAGQSVDAGQTIAQSGSTGKSTGPHLHFEVLDNGVAVDPATGWTILAGQ